MIEFHNEAVFYYEIPPELAVKTVESLLSHKFKTVLEGRWNIYFDDENFGNWHFSKVTCASDSRLTSKIDRFKCFEELSGDYNITASQKLLESTKSVSISISTCRTHSHSATA